MNLTLPPGDLYRCVVDGSAELPDPCSRFQPEGVRGPSCVVDVPRAARLGLDLDELVIYELHVGSFSAEGTFDGVVPHLRKLRELGVTAIELMPVATFPGNRNWGYDGVYTSAPHPAYGGPDGLARLVDAARGGDSGRSPRPAPPGQDGGPGRERGAVLAGPRRARLPN